MGTRRRGVTQWESTSLINTVPVVNRVASQVCPLMNSVLDMYYKIVITLSWLVTSHHKLIAKHQQTPPITSSISMNPPFALRDMAMQSNFTFCPKAWGPHPLQPTRADNSHFWQNTLKCWIYLLLSTFLTLAEISCKYFKSANSLELSLSTKRSCRMPSSLSYLQKWSICTGSECAISVTCSSITRLWST